MTGHFTVWKLRNFPATLILREINFGWFQKAKTWGCEFCFLEVSRIPKNLLRWSKWQFFWGLIRPKLLSIIWFYTSKIVQIFISNIFEMNNLELISWSLIFLGKVWRNSLAREHLQKVWWEEFSSEIIKLEIKFYSFCFQKKSNISTKCHNGISCLKIEAIKSNSCKFFNCCWKFSLLRKIKFSPFFLKKI